MPLMGMYGVTKTALHGLTKALATELAPDTRVNCIAPGYIPTHFAGIITNSDPIVSISTIYCLFTYLIIIESSQSLGP